MNIGRSRLNNVRCRCRSIRLYSYNLVLVLSSKRNIDCSYFDLNYMLYSDSCIVRSLVGLCGRSRQHSSIECKSSSSRLQYGCLRSYRSTRDRSHSSRCRSWSRKFASPTIPNFEYCLVPGVWLAIVGLEVSFYCLYRFIPLFSSWGILFIRK